MRNYFCNELCSLVSLVCLKDAKEATPVLVIAVNTAKSLEAVNVDTEGNSVGLHVDTADTACCHFLYCNR